MKVLVFTNLYPNNMMPHHGVFVKERMTKFAELNGNEVRVVAPVPYFPPIKKNWRWKYSQIVRKETIEGVEVYHPRFFMIPKMGMPFYGLMMFLSVLPAVLRIRKKFDFDLIDAHYVYPDGFAAVMLGVFFKKPVVVSARGSDVNLFMRFPLIKRLLRLTLNQAHAAIGVCQALKDAMHSLNVPARKIAVIPNGVDKGKFYPMPKKAARNLHQISNSKMMLSVGELIPRKGFHILIDAMAKLVHERGEDDLQLIIAGEGAYRPDLEEQIRDRGLTGHVRLIGSVQHGELRKWYCSADLFCLASDREGWPNVVLESLACGTPVVATNIWGVPEIITSDEFGLLTERTALAFADNIARALRKTWHHPQIVRYAEEHTWDKVALEVSRVFESVLNGNVSA